MEPLQLPSANMTPGTELPPDVFYRLTATLVLHRIRLDHPERLLVVYPPAGCGLDVAQAGAAIFWLANAGELHVPRAVLDAIDSCLNENVDYLALPIGLYTQLGGVGHANMLLYNTRRRELELFEPHGRLNDDRAAELDARTMRSQLGLLFPRAEFVDAPSCPLQGGQGTCQVWSTWFAHMRVLNPELSADALADAMRDASLAEPDSDYILRYAEWMAQNARDILEDATGDPNAIEALADPSERRELEAKLDAHFDLMRPECQSNSGECEMPAAKEFELTRGAWPSFRRKRTALRAPSAADARARLADMTAVVEVLARAMMRAHRLPKAAALQSVELQLENDELSAIAGFYRLSRRPVLRVGKHRVRLPEPSDDQIEEARYRPAVVELKNRLLMQSPAVYTAEAAAPLSAELDILPDS